MNEILPIEKMPYRVLDVGEGYYIILNKENKSTEVHFDDCPIYFKLKGLSPFEASRISYKGDPDMKEIYLYGDECVPTENIWNMREYMERVELLRKLYADEL